MIVPKVSIIVPTWLEKNKKFLDLAIESIKNLNYPKEALEVIIVGKKSYQPQYEGVTTVAPDSDYFYAPEGLNFGFRAASKDSEYFFMMNDDVMLTKDSIFRMIQSEKTKFEETGHHSVFNALSPCDNYRLYDVLVGYRSEGKPVFMTKQLYQYEEMAPIKDTLINAQSFYPFGRINMPFLCMFATLIPRSAWELVGEFDENFKTGQDDIDWCFRAQNKGIALVVALDAVIWHFGGITSSETIKNDMRVTNVEYFVKKWGQFPPFVNQQTLDDMRNERVSFKRD